MILKPNLFLELLERGSVPLSRLRATFGELRSPLDAGLLRRRGRGAGEVIAVMNPEGFRAWLKNRFPGAFEEVDAATPRVANLLMNRDSKRGQAGLDFFTVLAKAYGCPERVLPDDRVLMESLVDATRKFGSAGLYLGVPGLGRERQDPRLPGGLRIMTVENPTVFDQSEALRGEADVFLMGGTGGRMRDAMMDWVAAQVPARVIHSGDFDPVGLQEFEKLHRRMPGKVAFHLPEGLEDMFQRFSNRGLLELDNNRAILASIRGGIHPSADRVLALVLRYGPLEQEAVLLGARASDVQTQ